MPPVHGLAVVRSPIHGYGMRTTTTFSAGETVCRGDGVLYRAEAVVDDGYMLIFTDEDTGHGNPVFLELVCQTRWINHSCDPNTEVCSLWDPDRQRMDVWWSALRDIAAGEELSYDYGLAAEVAEPCACGSSKCRGVIVENDVVEMTKLPDHLRKLARTP